MQMSSSMVFLALVAIAYAAPPTMPPTMPPTPAKTSYEAASQEISQLLQQGNDESACADLAKTLSDEVSDSVEEANKQLAALDDGSSCPSEGQEAVSAAQSNQDNADKAADEAKNAAATAADASVDFGSYSLKSLESMECGQFWEDEAYKSAVAASKDAGEESVKTEAAAKAAAEALNEAQKAAATAVEECQCNVRASVNKAWEAAVANDAANEAAWTKAAHMSCVLAGTAAADCKVTDAPTPEKPTLADGVPADECSKEVASCWSSKLEGKYIQEQHGKTNECYALDTAKAKCQAASDCHGIATQSNVCGGKYRVSHGTTATLLTYANWKQYNLWAYTLDRSCVD